MRQGLLLLVPQQRVTGLDANRFDLQVNTNAMVRANTEGKQ